MRPLPLITLGLAALLIAALGLWSSGDETLSEADERRCLAVEPAVVDFQTSPVDGLWLRRVEIRNCGDAALVLTAPVFEGAFSQVGPHDDAALQPGERRTITVGFAPDHIGPHEGRAHLTAECVTPVALQLRGEGVVADECPPLTTRLGEGQVPATRRDSLCAPLAAPALLDGTGLIVEPVIVRVDDSPSI